MPSPVVIWIWFCAYLNCAGWVLSALHRLDKVGYAVVFALGFGALWFWKQKTGAQLFPRIHPPKFRRRFKRIFPLCFLGLAALAFLGGALYAPVNFDALAYRTPRVLNWLAENGWHWIHTDFQRLNTRTAGFEWLTAPQFLFLHTDRFVFLLNVISFLLLPGRIFAVLTRLGVGPRAAWHWMWLFPSGYGYALQAGSILNDMFGAVLTLTAFEFALRARRSKNFSDVSIASLAAALMTAVKAFNLVLLLPWAIAILPAWKILPRRPLATLALILFAASASLLPTAVMNWRVCHDWTGLKMEQATIGGMAMNGQVESLRLLANVVSLFSSNLVPPAFPFGHQWENFMSRITPAKLSQDLHANMEAGLAENKLPDLQTEEFGGLGCGVSGLLLLLLIWKLKNFRRSNWPGLNGIFGFEFIFFATIWLGVVVIMMKSGASGPARYFLPVYPLLVLPLLDAGAQLRRGAGRILALLIFSAAAALVVIAPQRPLWPATTVLKHFDAEHSAKPLLQRAWAVYSVFGNRAAGFAAVLEQLPPDTRRLGFIGFDEPEGALWQPFGSRRIVHISRDDSAAAIRQNQIQYALVSLDYLEQPGAGSVERWRQQSGAEPVADFQLRLRAGRAAEKWQLVRFP
jgi:hypothetical protein